MAEVTTTLVKHEEKPGDDYVLHKFQAADGKRFQTFDDEIAARVAGLLNQPVRLTFHVQERTSGTRKFNNNVIDDVVAASDSVGSDSSPASSGALVRATAFASAVDLVTGSVVDLDPEEDPFSQLAALADAIVAYAEGALEDPDDITPES